MTRRDDAIGLFEECAFVAVTTTDLARSKHFWVERLRLPLIREEQTFFMIDAGGTRLCFDLPDGNAHTVPGQDPVIGLRVKDLQRVLAELKGAGVEASAGPFDAVRGRWAELRDPDGRKVILTESG